MTHCRYSVCPRPGHHEDPAAASPGHPRHLSPQQPRQEDRPRHQVRIHIYLCISTYECIYANIYLYIYGNNYECIYEYIYECLYVYISCMYYEYIYVYIYVY